MRSLVLLLASLTLSGCMTVSDMAEGTRYQMSDAGLLDLDAETLRQRLYTRRDQLAEGELPVPLKLLHINRCPVVAPLSVLRAQDRERLQLDMDSYQARALRLTDAQEVWRDKLAAIYAEEDFAPTHDPEQQLYDGFIGDRDRRLCEQVRNAEPAQLASQPWPFDDQRLPELLFRYRARNFPETLNSEEQQRWKLFCAQRLRDPDWGAPITLEAFNQARLELAVSATPYQLQVLDQWQHYADSLAARFNL